MIEDDCDGCEHHKQFESCFGSWCVCEDNHFEHDKIQNVYKGHNIGLKAHIVPKFNHVHCICPHSTNPPLKEGDLTLNLCDIKSDLI